MGAGTLKRQTIEHLPEELIGEILSNLAVKSLLRFKSVSKPWRSLISSAKFVKDHLNRSNSDPDLTHHSFIGIFYDNGTGLSVSSCSLKSLHVEQNQDDVVPTRDHHDRYAVYCEIVGSCNGLILIERDMYSFYLWNPSTREVKRLESPPQGECADSYGNYNYYCVYGFGYDDSSDDYKVVWVMYSRSADGSNEIHQTEIYSVRTDSWKKIDGFEKSFTSVDCRGRFLNGKLHWLGWKEDVSTIVSLALVEGEEKYQLLAMPANYDPWGPKLDNVGGYLSLICSNLVKDNGTTCVNVNVWVMMKYGVAESWTKIWTVSDFHDPRPIFDGVQPIWATRNGVICVVFEKSKVVVYNATNKLREYRINKDELQPPGVNSKVSEDDHFYECSARLSKPLSVYVGSLVSP